jgi:hypothetical protein
MIVILPLGSFLRYFDPIGFSDDAGLKKAVEISALVSY